MELAGTFHQDDLSTNAPNCEPPLVHWRYASINKCDKVLLDLAAIAIFWETWREHNNRLFNNSARSTHQTFHVCTTFISYWINFLSGGARKMTQRTLDRTVMGKASNNHSEDTQDRGRDNDSEDM